MKIRLAGLVIALSLVHVANAADLITFSNGAKTNADDVNANFNELASRITAVTPTTL